MSDGFTPMAPLSEEIRATIPCGHMEGKVYVHPDYTGCLYRPRSEWTKAAVLDAIAQFGYPEAVALSVNAMSLEDIRSDVLKCAGWMYRGRRSLKARASGAGKHVDFYTIDRETLDILTRELREEIDAYQCRRPRQARDAARPRGGCRPRL